MAACCPLTKLTHESDRDAFHQDVSVVGGCLLSCPWALGCPPAAHCLPDPSKTSQPAASLLPCCAKNIIQDVFLIWMAKEGELTTSTLTWNAIFCLECLATDRQLPQSLPFPPSLLGAKIKLLLLSPFPPNDQNLKYNNLFSHLASDWHSNPSDSPAFSPFIAYFLTTDFCSSLLLAVKVTSHSPQSNI